MTGKQPIAAIVLTGHRRKRRYLVEVHQEPVWLRATEYLTLCDLIRYRAKTITGLLELSPVRIHRLRRAMEPAAGNAASDQALIETGADADYCLTVDLDRVGLDPSFRELSLTKLLRRQEIEELLRCCRMVRSVSISGDAFALGDPLLFD